MQADRTFLLTDIEGSTRLWNRFPDQMLDVVNAHNAILFEQIAAHDGIAFKDTGDGQWVSFGRAIDAVDCALAIQLALAERAWWPVEQLRVRIGLHRGFTLTRGTDHCGQTINLTARLNALVHGGQILITQEVLDAVRREGGELRFAREVSFLDLGPHQLRDLPDAVRLHQLIHPRLRADVQGVLAEADETRELVESPRLLHGRDLEVAAVGELLTRHRVVTISGAPGIGKTRVAVRVANVVRHRFATGAVLVEPSNGTGDGFLLDLAASLGIYQLAQRPLLDIIGEYLEQHPTLVVVDGLLSAIERARGVIAELSSRCAASRFLVTSTESLGLDAERVFVLGPLATSADGGGVPPAVAMLLDTMAYDATHAPVVDEATLAGLCDAVDGLPLAIELVAVHAATQGARAVLDGIAAIDMVAPLRDVLGESIARVSEPARRLLVDLSEFVGGFTLATVVAVCDSGEVDRGRAAELVNELRRHSLIAEVRRSPNDVWYRLLEPIRRFAREGMSADDFGAGRDRHAAGIAALVLDWSGRARGRDEELWAEQIDGHWNDIAGVVRTSIEQGDVDRARDIVINLWDYAHNRMRADVWSWADQLVEAVAAERQDATVLGIAALGAWMRGDALRAMRLADEAMQRERDTGAEPTIPARLAYLNVQSYMNEDRADPPDLTWAFVDLFEASADAADYWAVNVRVIGAIGLAVLGEDEAARSLADEGLQIGRAAANPSTLAWALFGAAFAHETRDEPLAEAYADEAVRVARTVGNLWVETIATGLLATLRRRVAGGRAAVPLLLELLSRWERSAHLGQQWHAIRAAGFALLQSGATEVGLALITASKGATLVMPLLPSERAELTAAVEEGASAVGEEERRAALARGRVVDLAGATRVAREHLLELADADE